MLSIASLGEWELLFKSDSKPKEVVIEVTTKCNYSCIHCFRNLMLNEVLGDMSERTFNNVVRGLDESDVRKVVFSGWGEPLTHPRILEFIKRVKDLGIYTVLNTNGFLLSKYADELFKSEIDEIVVSVDSVETDIYKSIRVGGLLSDVIKGVLRICELRGYGSKPELTMWFTMNALNLNDIPKVPSFARSLGIRKIVFSHIVPLSKKHEKDLAVYASNDLLIKLSQAFEEISKEVLAVGGYVITPKHKPIVERSCPFISNMALFIRWDGLIAPCMNYAHSWRNTFFGVERTIKAVTFGSVNEENLLNLWRKKGFVLFRFKTAFFIQPSCLDCHLSNYCSYTASNMQDCWGNTPTCAHCPYSHHIVMCPL
ncbi:MAG: radical SAM protein [Sulfolobales archaeon]